MAWGILAFIVVVVLVVAGMYNSLVIRRNEVKNAFGGLDANLKKRHDLIPNLISTVQAYMKHEADLLTKITQLRTRAITPGIDPAEKVDVENKLNHALGGLMISVENYPDLKASQNFLDLQRSMNEVEEQISASRRTYNSAVTDLNNGIETFPSNFIASFFKFKKEHVLETPDAERKNFNAKALFNQK